MFILKKLLNCFKRIDNKYYDFEIVNDDHFVINFFSMSEKEINNNFRKNLIKNISEVMNTKNIKILSIDNINKNAIVVINNIKMNIIEIKECQEINRFPDHAYDYEDYNPYEDGPWGDTEWFCIRCGNSLNSIAKDDKHWSYLWETMKKKGTQWMLCSNKECCHNDSPLVLHNPTGSYDTPAGDSYSISWVK